MYTDAEWKQFCRTGKVADYLRYRGVTNGVTREESANYATQDGRPDHPGEQSYR
ncbi:MAG: hypothetical protein IJ465_03240 [Clostridia bacterium]|nr:hypothetical protein [Clostridia bacterium]